MKGNYYSVYFNRKLSSLWSSWKAFALLVS